MVKLSMQGGFWPLEAWWLDIWPRTCYSRTGTLYLILMVLQLGSIASKRTIAWHLGRNMDRIEKVATVVAKDPNPKAGCFLVAG